MKIQHLIILLIFFIDFVASAIKNDSENYHLIKREKRSVGEVFTVITGLFGFASGIYTFIEGETSKKESSRQQDALQSNHQEYIKKLNSVLNEVKSLECIQKETLSELKELKDQIKILIDSKNQAECAIINQDYRTNWLKIQNMIDSFRNLQLEKDKKVAIYNLKKNCSSDVNGVDAMYTFLKHFLQEDEIKKYFTICCNQNLGCIQKWADYIERLAKLYVAIISGCEKIFDYKTSFKSNEFLRKIQEIIYFNYARTFLLSDSLENDISKILEENKYNVSTYKIVDLLTKRYNHFDWKVIYTVIPEIILNYSPPISCNTSDYYEINDSTKKFCGVKSKSSIRKYNNGYGGHQEDCFFVLVSYCYNKLSIFEEETPIYELIKDKKSKVIERQSYAKPLLNIHNNNTLKKNYDILNIPYYEDYRRYVFKYKITYLISSNHSNLNIPTTSIFMPDTNAKYEKTFIASKWSKIENLKMSSKFYDTNWKNINSSSIDDCLTYCENLEECAAVTVSDKSMNTSLCHLIRYGFSSLSQKEWISYAKTFIYENLILKHKSFESMKSKSLNECWLNCLKKKECSAISYKKKVTNCLMFLSTFTELDNEHNVDWITYTKIMI